MVPGSQVKGSSLSTCRGSSLSGKLPGQDLDRHGRMVLSNRPEASAVVNILGQLVARDQCDIQVFAPYNRQADLIRKTLSKARADGNLRTPRWTSTMPKGKAELGPPSTVSRARRPTWWSSHLCGTTTHR